MSWAKAALFVTVGSFGICSHAYASIEAQELLNRSLRQEAMSGPVSTIERVIKRGADINGKAPYGETALDYAIRFGRYKAALRLIQLGANPNSEDESGVTPLLRAASQPDASRVVEALLRAGADVNHHDLYGTTALMNAAQADSIRTVAVILLRAKNNVDIDARNEALESASSLARNGLVSHMLEMARRYQRGERSIELVSPDKIM